MPCPDVACWNLEVELGAIHKQARITHTYYRQDLPGRYRHSSHTIMTAMMRVFSGTIIIRCTVRLNGEVVLSFLGGRLAMSFVVELGSQRRVGVQGMRRGIYVIKTICDSGCSTTCEIRRYGLKYSNIPASMYRPRRLTHAVLHAAGVANIDHWPPPPSCPIRPR